MTELLTGVSVVELTGNLGETCSQFLASLGARVTRVSTPHTLHALRPLLSAADVLVEYSGSSELLALRAEQPRLIHASITPFGAAGPRAHFRGGELVCAAMGGVLRMLGDRDRAPVKEALDACLFHAHGAAAAAIMLAYHERELSGRGQHVDISVQEVAASRLTNAVVLYQFDQRRLERTGQWLQYGRAAVRCIWPLRDGYAFHTLMSGRFGAPANAALSAWMDELGYDNPLRAVDWLRYDRSALPAETRAVWETALGTFFSERSKAELDSEGQRRGINAAVLCEPADVLADPQLRARGFWLASERDGKSLQMPGHFLRAQLTAPREVHPLPRRVAHPSAALAGVKVLDLSWALVGSLSTKALADHGACVVKVESRKRPCLTRLDVQVARSSATSLDDKPWYAQLNSSKLSVQLDLKHARAREVLAPLVEWADIVVENFSPGTLDKLGLSYASLQKKKADLIMISASAYGQTGPLSQSWGVDGTIAARSGRTFLSGWSDRDPVLPGAVPYADAVVPQFMVAALSAALTRRRHTGQGCYIDVSMLEISAHQMARALLEQQLGAAPRRGGNRDRSVWHQGVYKARGEDRWLAISLFDRADYQRLCEVVPERWPPAAAVEAGQTDALDARISDYTSQHDAHSLMQTLQAAGIAAGAVQDIADLLDNDPQLRSRPAWVTLDHAKLGPFEHQTTPYHLDRTPGRPTAAPLLGEHSEHVCVHLLGLNIERYRELQKSGLFT
jgi:crotonobetainyl-CoA:carnitine CoA-transferase CaiB-like acyl-CoA transferase